MPDEERAMAEATTFFIDSLKEPWLKEALERATLEKRELFREFAFWILEGCVFPNEYYFVESRKNVFFYFNRITGEFKYSFEVVPERMMDVFASGMNYNFLYHQAYVRFLEFFYGNDRESKEKILLKELIPMFKNDAWNKIRGLEDPFLLLIERNSKEDLKDFFRGRIKN